MTNYAKVDVHGTHPVTGQEFLIASQGSEIPAEYDSLVDAGDKQATPLTSSAPTPNRETATLTATFAAVGAAADADQTVGEAPFDGVVIGVAYVPEANITGNNAESRHWQLINKGQDGNGTTVVASLDFDTGVSASDFDEKVLTLSSTAANLDVAEGDVLAFVSTHEGTTGLADPGGQVRVEINPNSD